LTEALFMVFDWLETFEDDMRLSLFLVLYGLLTMWLSLPAPAQDVRAPNGNLLYRYSQEGNRLVRRAPNGNMLDYSQRQSNGTIDTRAPNGNLLSRETPR